MEAPSTPVQHWLMTEAGAGAPQEAGTAPILRRISKAICTGLQPRVAVLQRRLPGNHKFQQMAIMKLVSLSMITTRAVAGLPIPSTAPIQPIQAQQLATSSTSMSRILARFKDHLAGRTPVHNGLAW